MKSKLFSYSASDMRRIILKTTKKILQDYNQFDFNIEIIRDVYTHIESEKIITIKLRSR